MNRTLVVILSGLGLSLALNLAAKAGQLPAQFEESIFVQSLSVPTAMQFAPDGRLFVCEKNGALRVVTAQGTLLPTPFLNVNVAANSERGLLGIAFDPDFAVNRYVYVYYTRASAPIKNRLSRFTASAANPNLAEPGSELVLIDNIASDAGNHNGGAIHFGPDGKLYVGIGDGGANPSNSQTLTNLSGKLLRVDPANPANLIPPDNPFVNTSGARGEIWAYGLRNPFTFAFQPGTSRVFINDVGQNTWEEVNSGAPGANYGWPTAEGPSTNPAFTNPTYTYNHGGQGASIAGGAFYQGSQFPSSYQGTYFFGDYVRGFIRQLTPPSYGQATEFATGVGGIVDIAVGADGKLYYLVLNTGRVYQVRYVGQVNSPPNAVLTANPTSGLAPLAVNLDASASTDPNGDALTYSWNFGDGSSAQGAVVSHTYNTGTYQAVLTVSDGRGGTDTETITITAGNNAPVPAITSPVSGTLFSGGETINYAGTGTDLEDGSLGAAAFTWQVDYYTGGTQRPFLPATAGNISGSFTIPTSTPYTLSDVFYRIRLKVTDSIGLVGETFRDIQPRTATIRLRTVPEGLSGVLTLDGQPVTPPVDVVGVVGIQRILGAERYVRVNANSYYRFAGWSDGGGLVHTISTPATDTTYTATYNLIQKGQ